MITDKHALPPVPRGESPIPVSEVPPEDTGGLDSRWLDRRAQRGDGPPYFRPAGSKRRMTYRSLGAACGRWGCCRAARRRRRRRR